MKTLIPHTTLFVIDPETGNNITVTPYYESRTGLYCAEAIGRNWSAKNMPSLKLQITWHNEAQLHRSDKS